MDTVRKITTLFDDQTLHVKMLANGELHLACRNQYSTTEHAYLSREQARELIAAIEQELKIVDAVVEAGKA